MSEDPNRSDGWEVGSGPADGLRLGAPPAPAPTGWPRAAIISVSVLGALLGGILVFWLGVAVGSGDDVASVGSVTEPDVTVAAAPSAAPAPTATPAAAPTPTATPTATPTPTPTATATPTATPAPTATPTPSPSPRVQGPDEPPVRRAVLRDGTIFLRGRVPSQDVADEIAGKVARVVGPDDVRVEYRIDPDAPVPASAPLLVADTVLFAPGSADVRAPFEPLLDLGADLLTRFPRARLRVIGHTDGVGSAQTNMALSRARVDAVTRALVQRGVARDQIRGFARGEQDPIAPQDTAEGRAANRRTEFEVVGLLKD